MSPTLVLIDAAIENPDFLASGVNSDATIAFLDASEDGITQISAILAHQENLDSVHLFSHGAPGLLRLGSSILSLDTIDAYDLAPWQQALRHANLLIYGCQVAQGEIGDRFLQILHQRTQANIAATATPTGNAAQGGDWNLERRIGAIEPTSILHPDVMAQYDATLQQQIVQNILFGVVSDTREGSAALYQINENTGEVERVVDGELTGSTFALSRQNTTGNLYYIRTRGEDDLRENALIDFYNPRTAENSSPGVTTGVDALFVKLGQAQDGTLYAMDGSTANLYRITVAADGTPSQAESRGRVRVGGPNGRFLPTGGGDVAFDPNNEDQLYAIVTDPDSPNRNLYQLFVINVQTLIARLVGNVRMPNNGPVLNDRGSGSLAFGNDGFLYLTSQSDRNGRPSPGTNRLFRVDPRTGIVEDSFAIEGNLEFNDFATLPITTTTNPDDPDNPGNCREGEVRRGIRNRDNRMVGAPNTRDRLIGANRNDTLLGLSCSDTLSGGEGDDLLRGGTANDLLQGDAGNDRLNGGSGNDRVFGGLGVDLMLGGTGADRMDGGSGNDTVLGEAGDDTVQGNDGNDLMRGSSGTDILLGGSGNDRMSGGSGDDELVGGVGSDLLVGNTGNDRMQGNDGNDGLSGEEGSDRMRGNAGNDQMLGGLGNDAMIGNAGRDLLRGNAGDDRMRGDQGDDRMSGGAGNDLVDGGDGNDFVVGNTGRDTLLGGVSNDRLFGDAGNDFLDGGEGEDRLVGRSDNDSLFGDASRDRLFGGLGNDILVGGVDADILRGDEGRDRFIYRAINEGRDRILAFASSDDRIDLSRIFNESGFGSSNPFARYVRLQQVGADTRILLDVNGDRAGGFETFITLVGTQASTVSSGNFIV